MKNLVIIVAGGGNDVFSGVAYINSQYTSKRHSYSKIALIGILGLTPFHSNEPIKPNQLNIEKPIIFPSESTKRYIVMNPPKEIYANESMLPQIIKSEAAYINYCVCLSPKYSAKYVADSLRQLFLSWNMDAESTMIEVVDFGGDILTDGKQSSIISPELDAFSLAVTHNLLEYQSRVVVCFPGVDGELTKSYLEYVCNNRSVGNQSIDSQAWINNLQSLYALLESKRPGNTIPNMLKVLNSLSDKTLPSCRISKGFTVGRDKYNFTKPLDISMSLQDKIHYFDIGTICKNNPYVDIFNADNYDLKLLINNILDVYSKQTIDESTNQLFDMQLQFLRQDIDADSYTNRHIVVNDIDNIDNTNNDNNNNKDKQKVIFVNLIPYPLSTEQKIACNESIKNLKTFDELFC